MTLLEEFIFSLNRTEREKLRPLQFRGAKRTIFMKILNLRNENGMDLEKIRLRLKLSKKRFYQMLAEMLRSCYADVAPAGGTELLQYLGNMQLYRHFYQEMKRQEALLIKENDRTPLEDFYFKVLLMSEFFLIPPHLAGHIQAEFRAYLRRYAQVKTKHFCDEKFIRCGEIEDEIQKNFSRNFSLKKLRAQTDELETILECLSNHDHALAKFKVAYLLAKIYFGNFFADKRPEPYLEYINQIVDEHTGVFGSTADLIRLGTQSYLPPKQEDIEQYKEFLQRPSPTGETSSLLFIERFLPLIVQNGEIAWAKKFIAERFPIDPGRLRNETSLHWWRLLAIYHINADEFSEAQLCVWKALAANTGKTRTTALEMNLRCFSVFLLIMTEGPALASDTVLRHIRYARRHGYNKGEGFMMIFLKAIYDLVSYPDFDKAHARKIRERYLNELGGERRLFLLFEKIYEKYFR